MSINAVKIPTKAYPTPIIARLSGSPNICEGPAKTKATPDRAVAMIIVKRLSIQLGK